MSNTIFLDIKNLSKSFNRRSGILRDSRITTTAVDNVSFNISEGECFGLIGESGSGKSTLGRCLIRLEEPDLGQVLYHNTNLLELSCSAYQPYRPKFQMIFQNPGLSLNPLHSIRHAISEPLHVHKSASAFSISARLEQLISAVGLDDHILNYLPHQLSGGQKQRVVIARALAVEPSFIIADEPTSNVDASLKRQILDLIKKIRDQFGMTVLLITHDLSVVAYAAERTAVMHGGHLIEIAPTEKLMKNPGHPYTRQLIQSSRLEINFNQISKNIRMGEAESGLTGCNFISSCPFATNLCRTKIPELQQAGPERYIACHHPEKLLNK